MQGAAGREALLRLRVLIVRVRRCPEGRQLPDLRRGRGDEALSAVAADVDKECATCIQSADRAADFAK